MPELRDLPFGLTPCFNWPPHGLVDSADVSVFDTNQMQALAAMFLLRTKPTRLAWCLTDSFAPDCYFITSPTFLPVILAQ